MRSGVCSADIYIEKRERIGGGWRKGGGGREKECRRKGARETVRSMYKHTQRASGR